MADKMTPEQALASDPKASVWVGANAGTGKTHVLTARVLRMMLQGTDPGKILCLTYTKAAAKEMTNRLYRRLGQWTRMDDDALRSELSISLDEVVAQDKLSLARSLFARVLDLPGGLKIMTIHSFCNSLLGRFPLEADLPPQFEQMDERSQQEWLDNAADQTFSALKAGHDDAGKQALFHIARRVSDFTFGSLLQSVTGERGRLLKAIQKRVLRGSYDQIESLFSPLADALGVDPTDTRETIADELLNSSKQEAIRQKIRQCFMDGSQTVVQRGDQLGAILATEAGPKRLQFYNDYILVFLNKTDLQPFKVGLAGLYKKHPDLEPVLSAEQQRVLALVARDQKRQIFNQSTALLKVSAAILNLYEGDKTSLGKVDFDDLILRTDALLAKPDIAPWILYKLDGGLDHILVDEAQDTNPEQWQLIERLSNEFYVGEGAREVDRTLFMVGDAKQSIYRFQRADPAEFVRSRDRVRDKAEASEKRFVSIDMQRSFRSTKAVLGLVDAVFSRPEAHQNLTHDNSMQVKHTVNREGQAGLVELWPVVKETPISIPEHWEPPEQQVSVPSGAGQLARLIAVKIDQMLKTNERLESRDRPVRAGDIIILVRRRNEFHGEMIRALKALQIPVAGSDRLNVMDHIGVMDLIALTNMTLNPLDDLTFATVLKSPFIGFDDEDLYQLAHDRGGKTLWQRLQEQVQKGDDSLTTGQHARFAEAAGFIQQVTSMADFMSPFQFYADILSALKGRQKLVGRLGPEVHDPLDEFLNLALDYETNRTPSLQGFVQWLASGTTEIKRDMESPRDEVRIMTIHGAKGLQAPIVFMPDTTVEPKSGGSVYNLGAAGNDQQDGLFVWHRSELGNPEPINSLKEHNKTAELAEYRRLMYVAMTRAEDHLYVCGWEKSRKRTDKCWYNLIEAGFDLLPNVEKVDVDFGESGLIKRWKVEQTRPAKRDDKKQKAVDAQSVRLPQWVNQLPKDEGALSKPLAPSKMDDSDDATASPLKGREQDISRYMRGTMIHKLLEILPESPAEKREALARAYLSKGAYHLDQAQINDIWEKLSKLLNDDNFAAIFGAGSQAEVSFSAIVAGKPVAGQIDRLVVMDDKVLVVDYKTNRPPAKTLDAVPKSYVAQMAVYAQAMQAIYPNKQVACALLWTEEMRLMTLPSEMLKNALSA